MSFGREWHTAAALWGAILNVNWMTRTPAATASPGRSNRQAGGTLLEEQGPWRWRWWRQRRQQGC